MYLTYNQLTDEQRNQELVKDYVWVFGREFGLFVPNEDGDIYICTPKKLHYELHPHCTNCGGTGEVDSGAPDPQGYFVNVTCPECEGTGLRIVQDLNNKTEMEVRREREGEW